MDILRFWGKAQPRDPDDGPQWHPLVFHCLDVAAVGAELLACGRGPGEGLIHLLGLPREQAVRLIGYLLCLHDIGKFAKKFQAKVPHRYPDCFGDDPAVLATRYDHGVGGLRLYDADGDLFNLPRGSSRSAWRPLISAVTGHHGSPPEPRVNDSLVSLRPDYGTAGLQAAGTFIQRAHELFAVPVHLSRLDRACARRASYALAGVAILADWIGSSQEWFPYCEPHQDLGTYWNEARRQAVRAVEEAGVIPAGVNARLDYGTLIGGHAPTPMQAWAQRVDLPAGPALFMIEDETGSGKTEAALMLAHRLMASGRADGIYVALPTMATANAMFDRLAAAHRRLFAADDVPSVALVHGAREMHRGFRSAMRSGGRNECPYSRAGGPDEAAETTASAACAAWIADDRRRAFLADAGAGTVDQALLSVLPSRHHALRLLGLMRRVLVLDEVHAYDAYMQREIESLLEFQAGLGGSSILLSATLPLSVRQRLADSFAKGLGDQSQSHQAMVSSEYPLATVCGADTRTFTRVQGRSGRARSLSVRFLRTPDEGLDAVEHAAHAGRAVLYIRNTVDDALDAHAALTDRGLTPDLFHARFALVDRLDIESRVAGMFGKDGRASQRAGRVLVATQVVEQSLDLDFDALVTDLAPIDLLIQRAGRLWRHDRPERTGHAELQIVAPEPELDAPAGWFRTAFPRVAYVYRDHARLWLTARVLKEAGAIESPGGLRALIEAVYGGGADQRLPDALRHSFFDAKGREGAERGVATTNVLDLAKGYVWDGGAWDSDARTPTRLVDEPHVTLRLARVRDGRVEPYAYESAPDEPWRAWRLSEVSASARRIGGEAVPAQHATAAAAAKADWTRLDSEKVLVVLEEAAADGLLLGSAADGVSKHVPLRYDAHVGLIWAGVAHE
ncbi:MAG: CRISPR-associated helicase Cas3' [Spirochaetaceae bacterium]|nr:CRISPR-associated helicase Cas3' [Spirochaetaceae bacterium]